MPRRRLEPFPQIPDVGGVLVTPGPGDVWYVNTQFGSDVNNGKSWQRPLQTMSAALTRADTGDTIYFVGKVTEELTGSNLKFDITIVGAGGLHHADQPDSTYNSSRGYPVGSSIWAPPASPTTATPLLKVRGRGWRFINIMFDCPVDSAALYLERNALSGTSEYDPSHASVINCRFVDGKYGIQDVGGAYNVTVEGCEFKACTTGAIVNTSTAVANPLNWKIRNCRFPANVSSFGNATHIDSPLNSSYIRGNLVGTVTSTALYIDLTGGNGNIVTENYLMGSFDTSDYVAGTGDGWSGNITADISGNSSVDASGITIAAPAAP